jgi:SNF2 family DNA or RNA helicase
VRARLDQEGITSTYLDGSTRNRGDVVDEFRHGDAPVFLISLKAGGVGLTLTEADYCFVLDPWWNPAVEAQAVDRAHRIGQQRPVMVYRLVAVDTVEEKVMELKARKAALFARVVDGDALMAAPFGADDVRALFDD